jgi:hypothetical protein
MPLFLMEVKVTSRRVECKVTNVRKKKITKMSLETNNKNNPGDVKG